MTADAFRLALRCDPVSAFGGIIALNRRLDAETARAIAALFVEVVVAPEISAAAQAIFEETGRSGLRLLETGGMPDPAVAAPDVRTIAGGLLVQDRDRGEIDEADLRVVTTRAPTADEMRDLLFAFTVCKHVKSNAIVYAKNGATVGVGAGQMSRVDSARVAAGKAVEAAQAAGLGASLAAGSVVASDAFFPFPDGLLAAVEAGATAVIQPGGSVRDKEGHPDGRRARSGHAVHGHAALPALRPTSAGERALHGGGDALQNAVVVSGPGHRDADRQRVRYRERDGGKPEHVP